METKFDFDMLDCWINLESIGQEQDQESYLDKIELNLDQESMFGGSFYLDKLFDKKTRHRRAWNLQEEQQLLEWFKSFQVPPSRQAWEEQSQKMQRSICSLYTKVSELKNQRTKRKRKESVENKSLRCSIHQAVYEALKTLDRPASKREIIRQISEQYEMPERGSWINSVKQFISSNKNLKKIPGVYSSNPMKLIQKVDCNSMERMILYALQILGGKADIKQIKIVVGREFEEMLNNKVNPDSQLMTWEKTFLKKLKQSTLIEKSESEDKYELYQLSQVKRLEHFLSISLLLELLKVYRVHCKLLKLF